MELYDMFSYHENGAAFDEHRKVFSTVIKSPVCEFDLKQKKLTQQALNLAATE